MQHSMRSPSRRFPCEIRRAFSLPPMARSSSGKKQPRPWNLTMFCVVAVAAVATHIFAASVVLPLYKDGICGRKQSNCSSLAISSAVEEDVVREKMVAATAAATRLAAEEEISVSITSGSRPHSGDSIINLDHGDPTMYEKFWRETGDAATLIVPGSRAISYFSDVTNLCWFLEPELGSEIRRLHRLVGNAAAADGRHIIVGTGSSQLFQAALYALSTSPEITAVAAGRPIPVVSSVPYYSSYPAATDLLRSSFFRWDGDASSFKDNGGPYIEVVCSPNNPDGSVNTAALSSSKGKWIHDLAYYWPQYTAITSLADHDIMLFTVSKCTGHAGIRLGWALVKDEIVAKRMVKFIEVSTIGVSKDSQLHAAKILKVVSDGYELEETAESYKLFHFGWKIMNDRWKRLREAAEATGVFSLPIFQPEYCNFMKDSTLSLPAFAWLKCEREIEDCESFLRENHKILTRSGKHFGTDMKFVRISMIDRDETFDIFIERLSSIEL